LWGIDGDERTVQGPNKRQQLLGLDFIQRDEL
jgi:hypothetical protein